MRSSGSLRRSNLSRSNGLERTGRLKIGVIGAGAVGSAQVNTATMPGTAMDLSRLIDLMRACGCGERNTFRWSAPSAGTSSV
jgi:hypothetical protein